MSLAWKTNPLPSRDTQAREQKITARLISECVVDDKGMLLELVLDEFVTLAI